MGRPEPEPVRDEAVPRRLRVGPWRAGCSIASPYPASTVKLLVAVLVLRLVDQRRLILTQHTANQAPGAACIEGGSLPAAGDEPVRSGRVSPVRRDLPSAVKSKSSVDEERL